VAGVIVGGLLLLWSALPLEFDSLSGLESISWPLLWIPALVLAAVAGTLEGISIRLGWPWWVAVSVFGVASFPAFVPPMFFVGWPEEFQPYTQVTELAAALLGWTFFVAASLVLAMAIGTLGHNRGGGGPRSQNA
jgi:hypothetical protein